MVANERRLPYKDVVNLATVSESSTGHTVLYNNKVYLLANERWVLVYREGSSEIIQNELLKTKQKKNLQYL